MGRSTMASKRMRNSASAVSSLMRAVLGTCTSRTLTTMPYGLMHLPMTLRVSSDTTDACRLRPKWSGLSVSDSESLHWGDARARRGSARRREHFDTTCLDIATPRSAKGRRWGPPTHHEKHGAPVRPRSAQSQRRRSAPA